MTANGKNPGGAPPRAGVATSVQRTVRLTAWEDAVLALASKLSGDSVAELLRRGGVPLARGVVRMMAQPADLEGLREINNAPPNGP